MTTKHRFATSFSGLLLIGGLTACDGDSTGPGARTVSMRFKAASTSAASHASVDIAAASNTRQGAEGLVIASAQIVLRNVKLQPSSETCDDDDSEGDDDSGNCATMS